MLVTLDAPLQQQTATVGVRISWTNFWTKKVRMPMDRSGFDWNEKRRLSV
ncbi:hypothetical protein F478_03454, partial [Pseudomonas sp. URIL14HWK12:I2]